MRSIRLLSSSVELPISVSSICLLSLLARSRTRRGKRLKTYSIGIIRIDMTDSCRSRALRCSWLMLVISSPWFTGSSSLERWASIDWVITSSPTRLISWSTFSTATRMEVDSLTRAAGFSRSARPGAGVSAGTAFRAGAAGTTAGAAGASTMASTTGSSITASKSICSGSITKHSTAMTSSLPIPPPSVAARVSLPFTTLLRVARLLSSSSSRLTSLSFRPDSRIRRRSSATVAATGAASTTLSFAGATAGTAASPLASRAN
ncbi:hypothetical protein D3C75_336020 [compost metagenome]